MDEENDRYLATGDEGATIGFIRIYEVTDENITIVYELKETDGDEYYDMIEEIEDGNYDAVYEMEENESRVVIQAPIAVGVQWEDGRVEALDKTIEQDGQEWEALVIEDMHSGNHYYYTEDQGLVQILHDFDEETMETFSENEVISTLRDQNEFEDDEENDE